MLAGVCGIDFALLVTAADDGVMPQTVEHLQILDLLGIRQGIAAITKTDRVTPQRVDQVAAQVRALLANTALAGIPLLPVSAVTGTGIDPLREALVAAAMVQAARYRDGQHFRLAIDRVFTVAGSGTVVTGTVFSGEAKPDDRLLVSPSGLPVRVRGIQIRGKAADHAQAGDRCAMNLSGVDIDAVARGDWVLHEAIHAPSQRLDARFTLLATERGPLEHWTPVHLHLATADVMARLATSRGAAIAPGIGPVQLVVEQPIAALNGDCFILRDQSAGRTLGGGWVIDPLAPATRRTAPARVAALAALERATPAAAFSELLMIPGQAVDVTHFETIFNLSAERAAALYRSADATVIGRDQRVAMARANAIALREGVVARLGEFHRAKPGIRHPSRCAAWELALADCRCVPVPAA
jgi:selenocysteine-specific elongation factor